MPERPAIPAATKRQVRQECRYGCVICGMPIFHYDHIVDYAEVREHSVENLALLCPNHHQDKTSGRLDAATVSDRRKTPFNAKRGFTTGHQLAPARRFNAIVGSNTGWKVFGPEGGDYAVVWVDGKGMLVVHAEDGWLSFSVHLTDSYGGQLVVVDRGELSVSTSEWDYDYQGVNLQVRRGRRELLLDMELASSRIWVKWGSFINNEGLGFVVDGEELWTVRDGRRGNLSIRCSSENDKVGGWAISRKGAKPPAGFGFVFPA